MNNTCFTICKANQEQRDYVLERFPKMKKEKRENAIIYVAVNELDNYNWQNPCYRERCAETSLRKVLVYY